MIKLLLLSIVGFFLFSCTKVSESYLVGRWEIVEGKFNGQVETPTLKTELEFNKDNTVHSYENGVLQYTTTWSLQKKEQILMLESEPFDIIERKGKTMKIKQQDGSDVYEYTLEKQ